MLVHQIFRDEPFYHPACNPLCGQNVLTSSVMAEHITLAGTGAEEENYASKNMGGALTRPNLGISPEGHPPYIHIMRTPERDYPGSPYCLERGRRSEPKPAMSSKPEVAR